MAKAILLNSEGNLARSHGHGRKNAEGRWFHVSARIVRHPGTGEPMTESPGVTYRRGDKPRPA